MQLPREQSVIRSPLGGASAVAIGLMNDVIILYFVCAPETGRDDANTFFLTFARNVLRSSLPGILFSITAVLSYAVLPVVHEAVRGVHAEGARSAADRSGRMVFLRRTGDLDDSRYSPGVSRRVPAEMARAEGSGRRHLRLGHRVRLAVFD